MKIRLRDDLRPCGSHGPWVGLADDIGVSAGLSDDSVIGMVGGVLPLITVRDRVSAGLDDQDNPQWTWVERVTDQPTIQWQQRTERDDRAGVTLVVAKATFLYPAVSPAIQETAVARTDDGSLWTVTAVTQTPDSLTLGLERVDDAA